MSSKRLTTYSEDVQFDAAFMEEYFDSDCQWLVALTDWQLSVILSAVRYAHWEARWVNYSDWSNIFWKVQELEHCLMSGCQVQDLVDAVNSISNKLTYNDKTIAQIIFESTPGTNVTLQEYLDSFEPDDIAQYPWMYAILTLLADILPSNMASEYRLEDPAAFTFDVMRGLAELITNILQAAFTGADAAADTGSAIADVGGTAVEGLDTIFQGITAGALSLQAIIDLINLFRSGQEPDPDTNPDLRALLRVYNNIFVEQQAMSVTQTNQQIVNCGGGFGSGLGGGVCFVADESGAGSSIDQPEYSLPEEGPPPSGWDSWTEYYTYKCKAANAMTLGIAERLYQLGDIGNGSYTGSTHAVTARNIETFLRNLDVAACQWQQEQIDAGALLPIFSTNPDEPLFVMLRSWAAQKIADYFYPTPDPDPFQIFYDLRLNWLYDREDRVCDLYNAESTSEAQTAILDAVDTYFSSYSYTTEEKSWAREIIEGMLLNSWLNLLFQQNDPINQYEDETAVDCADCGCKATLVHGTTTDPLDETGDIIVNSDDIGGGYQGIQIEWSCGVTLYIDSCDVCSHPELPVVIIRDINGQDIYTSSDGDVEDLGPFENVGLVEFGWCLNDPFTLDATLTMP